MNCLYIYLLLLLIRGNHTDQADTTVTKKVMIVCSYNELLQLPDKRPGQGDFTSYFISLYPSKSGALKNIIIGNFVDKIKYSKVFAYDIDRNSYLTATSQYEVSKSRAEPTPVLPPLKELPKARTYYQLKAKPITLQIWTAEALCERYLKEKGGKIDSIFIVKSLSKFEPLDNFTDNASVSIQYKPLK